MEVDPTAIAQTISYAFKTLNHWHWFALFAGLILAEMTLPGAYLMWIGFGAALTGFSAAAFPMSWEIQFTVFAVLSIASATAGRAWIRRRPIQTDKPTLNQRALRYVGQTGTLTKPIANGYGTVTFADTTHWRARCRDLPDLPEGTVINVTGYDNGVFLVAPVPSTPGQRRSLDE